MDSNLTAGLNRSCPLRFALFGGQPPHGGLPNWSTCRSAGERTGSSVVVVCCSILIDLRPLPRCQVCSDPVPLKRPAPPCASPPHRSACLTCATLALDDSGGPRRCAGEFAVRSQVPCTCAFARRGRRAHGLRAHALGAFRAARTHRLMCSMLGDSMYRCVLVHARLLPTTDSTDIGGLPHFASHANAHAIAKVHVYVYVFRLLDIHIYSMSASTSTSMSTSRSTSTSRYMHMRTYTVAL